MNDEPPRFRLRAAVQRIAPFANGLLLLAFLGWVLFFDGSRTAITDVEGFATQVAKAENASIRWLPFLGAGLVGATFLTMLIGLWRGRRESRSLRAWLILIFLVCGWLAAWLGRQDLYWYGHARRVSSEVSAATQLAKALDENWPSGDGDYPELGIVLGYPKENPVSLILAGEPVPIGKLRIVAVEKSRDGKILRLQLANPNHDTWLVRCKERTGRTEFVNSFDTHYSAKRSRQLSGEWFLIRYDS